MTHHTTAMDYRTAMVAIVPPTVYAGWTSSFELAGTTHTMIDATELFGGGIVGETTWRAPSEGMTVSQLGPSPTYKLLVQLTTLRSTHEDERWPGAVWPDERAFEDADTFIRRLPLTLIPLPEISLADDGEINFLWESDGNHVDLGFYGTRTCTFYARGKDGRRIHGEDVPASEGLPPEITALLAA